MAKERSYAQRARQDRDFRSKGRYAKVNPCYACGKSAGVSYFSHPLTDCGEWHDIAICLCKRCADETQEMTDPKEFLAYQKKKGGPHDS